MFTMGRNGNTFYTYFTSRWDGKVYKVEVEYETLDTLMDTAKKLSNKADQIELRLLVNAMHNLQEG